MAAGMEDMAAAQCVPALMANLYSSRTGSVTLDVIFITVVVMIMVVMMMMVVMMVVVLVVVVMMAQRRLGLPMFKFLVAWLRNHGGGRGC